MEDETRITDHNGVTSQIQVAVHLKNFVKAKDFLFD